MIVNNLRAGSWRMENPNRLLSSHISIIKQPYQKIGKIEQKLSIFGKIEQRIHHPKERSRNISQMSLKPQRTDNSSTESCSTVLEHRVSMKTFQTFI